VPEALGDDLNFGSCRSRRNPFCNPTQSWSISVPATSPHSTPSAATRRASLSTTTSHRSPAGQPKISPSIGMGAGDSDCQVHRAGTDGGSTCATTQRASLKQRGPPSGIFLLKSSRALAPWCAPENTPRRELVRADSETANAPEIQIFREES
jgi:hypothetical protein